VRSTVRRFVYLSVGFSTFANTRPKIACRSSADRFLSNAEAEVRVRGSGPSADILPVPADVLILNVVVVVAAGPRHDNLTRAERPRERFDRTRDTT